MAIEGNVVESRQVAAGIPQRSLVTLILFTIYTSGFLNWVEERVCGIEGLIFVENVGLMATGSDVSQVGRKLESCPSEIIDWRE